MLICQALYFNTTLETIHYLEKNLYITFDKKLMKSMNFKFKSQDTIFCFFSTNIRVKFYSQHGQEILIRVGLKIQEILKYIFIRNTNQLTSRFTLKETVAIS